MSPTASVVCSSRRINRIDPAIPERRQGRILVATHSSEGRRMISGMLRCIGFDISVAENSREVSTLALSAWKAGEGFDLILLDMNLSQIDGYEGTGVLRRQGYSGRIIALMSEGGFAGMHERCLGAGCDGYARKPVTFEMLRDVVGRYLPDAQPDSRDSLDC